MDPVAFVVAGHPQGKGRARALVRHGHIAHYTPEKTRSYESMIRGAAMDAMAGRAPIAVPVVMQVAAFFAVPQSWSKKRRDAALAGEALPGKKPDLSNVVKAAEDAINGVVLIDDALIVASYAVKRYSDRPRLDVLVKPA